MMSSFHVNCLILFLGQKKKLEVTRQAGAHRAGCHSPRIALGTGGSGSSSLSLFSFFGCGPGFKDVPQPGIEPGPQE